MRMQLNEAVSKRLTELLSERHMTQYQLFMKSGVPKSTIGNVINCSYESVKLPGYTEAYKPEFSSTATDFRVILKNVNYNLEGDAHQVIHQVTHQVIELSTVSKQILTFCTTPKSKKELAVFCGFKDLRNFTLKHINPLLESGQLEMTIPDKPKSRNQKYITVHFE